MLEFIKESLSLVLKLEMGFLIELIGFSLFCIIFRLFFDEFERQKDIKDRAKEQEEINKKVIQIKKDRGWK